VQDAVGFVRIEQRYEKWMVEPGRNRDLAQNALDPEDGREFRMQHLDGDGAREFAIFAEPDRGHPAAAELALDRVTLGQSAPQTGQQLGTHRRNLRSGAIIAATPGPG
jgi:hypothetical protein